MTPSSSIEDQAASWAARHCAPLSPAEEAAFQAWVAADPRHAAAYAEFESTLRTVAFPAHTGLGAAAVDRLNRRATRRRRRHQSLAAAGLALLLVGVAWISFNRPTTPLVPTARSLAVTARPDLRTLPDGTTVELNAGAEIRVSFSPDTRAVTLLGGEALFQVAHDTKRPFIVTAGEVAVRAVGTVFSVRYDEAEIAVLVTEGRVAVQKPTESAPPGSGPGGQSPSIVDAPTPPEQLLLEANSRVRVPLDTAGNPGPGTVAVVTARDRDSLLAWREQRVEFTNIPLGEAVTYFNREGRPPLIVSDHAAAAIRLSGIYWVNDVEGFIRLLQTGFRLEAQPAPDGIRLRLR